MRTTSAPHESQAPSRSLVEGFFIHTSPLLTIAPQKLSAVAKGTALNLKTRALFTEHRARKVLRRATARRVLPSFEILRLGKRLVATRWRQAKE